MRKQKRTTYLKRLSAFFFICHPLTFHFLQMILTANNSQYYIFFPLIWTKACVKQCVMKQKEVFSDV